jgi:hypothetical protein
MVASWGKRMTDQELVWMRCVEALLSRGKRFDDALHIADAIVASRVGPVPVTRPGLAKCRIEPVERALPETPSTGVQGA